MALSKIKTNSIADNAITSTKIGVDVIVAEDLASNSITVAEIASEAVTAAKIKTGVDFTFNGLTVGKGGGAGSDNTVVGYQAALNATGNYLTAVGYQAGYSNTDTTFANAFFGRQAGKANTSGGGGVAVGNAALFANTTGSQNTAIGASAMEDNTTGGNNTAVGSGALGNNTTASNNTALGYQAGYLNTTTNNNVLVGYQAGYSATTTDTSQNTFVGNKAGYTSYQGTNAAFGSEALYSNTTGDDNTAIGSYRPLYANTTGARNVAVGRQALGLNTTGINNCAVGRFALRNCTTGTENTALGTDAGDAITTGTDNTLVGYGAGYLMTTGSKNTVLGAYSGNQNGLDIRTASNRVVLSDGDGYPNMYFDDQSRRIENLGPVNGGLYRYKMRHWHTFQSEFNNPTVELCRITGGGTSSSTVVKVRVFQIEVSGSAAAVGNEHVGMASCWYANASSAHSHFVNTMAITTRTGTSNVGTLSWVSNGNIDSSLRYTANRASNYDSYYVEIEIVQNVGSNFIFTTPT
jgi:hypothetical protein